jgi:hypothetical protein
MNPPHQRDSLDDDVPQPMSVEELYEYYVENGIDLVTLSGQSIDIDPILQHSPTSLASGGSASHLQREGTRKVTCKGKRSWSSQRRTP